MVQRMPETECGFVATGAHEHVHYVDDAGDYSGPNYGYVCCREHSE